MSCLADFIRLPKPVLSVEASASFFPPSGGSFLLIGVSGVVARVDGSEDISMSINIEERRLCFKNTEAGE